MVNHTRQVSLAAIIKEFEHPLKVASSRLKVSPSLLKQRCREYGIKNWPYRKISKLKNQIRILELTNHRHPYRREKAMQQIVALQAKLDQILKGPYYQGSSLNKCSLSYILNKNN